MPDMSDLNDQMRDPAFCRCLRWQFVGLIVLLYSYYIIYFILFSVNPTLVLDYNELSQNILDIFVSSVPSVQGIVRYHATYGGDPATASLVHHVFGVMFIGLIVYGIICFRRRQMLKAEINQLIVVLRNIKSKNYRAWRFRNQLYGYFPLGFLGLLTVACLDFEAIAYGGSLWRPILRSPYSIFVYAIIWIVSTQAIIVGYYGFISLFRRFFQTKVR